MDVSQPFKIHSTSWLMLAIYTLIFSLSLSVCMYVYINACMHVYMCGLCLLACLYGGQKLIWGSFLYSPLYTFEMAFLTQPGVPCFGLLSWPADHRDPPVANLLSAGITGMRAVPGFLCKCYESKLRSQSLEVKHFHSWTISQVPKQGFSKWSEHTPRKPQGSRKSQNH